MLDHLADLPVHQVAREVEGPEGTIKARLSRGRAALAALLCDHTDNVPVAPSPSPDKTVYTAWKQQIPGDFDLTAMPPGVTFNFAGLDNTPNLTLCDRTVFASSGQMPRSGRLGGGIYIEGQLARDSIGETVPGISLKTQGHGRADVRLDRAGLLRRHRPAVQLDGGPVCGLDELRGS